ncbi:MAG: circadian clock protein KaiB [Chitinophagaceae bacterium]|nr:MAG: circadian clock protein KaiB [Chitinophagaceae bacterium]
MEIDKENNINWGEEEDAVYELRLFVNGTSPISLRAINNLKKLLEERIQGKYHLEIIDAHQQPLLVQTENVTAVPMLIKKLPLPKKRLVGDMSDIQKVLKGLGLEQNK